MKRFIMFMVMVFALVSAFAVYGQSEQIGEYRTIANTFNNVVKSERLFLETMQSMGAGIELRSKAILEDGRWFVSYEKMWDDFQHLMALGVKYRYLEDFQAQLIIGFLMLDYDKARPINRERISDAVNR